MYCLRLFFYKKYIVYQIVYMLVSSELLFSITSPSFVALHCLISEITNVLPEVVYYKKYFVYKNFYMLI